MDERLRAYLLSREKEAQGGFLQALKQVIKPGLSAAGKAHGATRILPAGRRALNLAKAYPKSTAGLAVGVGYVGSRFLLPGRKEPPNIFMS